MQKTYYIKATGSTCYNRTGITYPESIRFVHHASKYLATIVSAIIGQGDTYWGHIYDLDNTPEILFFDLNQYNEHRLDAVKSFIEKYPGLIVLEKNW